MKEILHCVDNLEHSVNNTSLSFAYNSSSDDRKRKRRLPSELSVSIGHPGPLTFYNVLLVVILSQR